jgi:hypothetical protein
MDERHWQGSIEELVDIANRRLFDLGIENGDPINIRLVRDYMQRGLLGDVGRKGREGSFDHGNLIRLVAARLLLADKWPLSKIRDYFVVNDTAAIESLIPVGDNPALRSIRQIRSEMVDAFVPPSPDPVLSVSAKMSSLQRNIENAFEEMKNVSGNKPLVEELTLIAVTPWCQVLVQSDRIGRITIDEAEAVGQSVTAGILSLVSRKRK